jgi:hypothetical protein
MHPARISGIWKASSKEGASKGVVRPEPGRVQIVMTNVEWVPHTYRSSSRRLVYLIFILEPRWWEIANRGPWSRRMCHARKKTSRTIRHNWPGRRNQRSQRVYCFLSPSLFEGYFFGLGCFHVTLVLEFRNEFLNNFDFEIIQYAYSKY